MKEILKKLNTEKDELQTKMNALEAFINSDNINAIPTQQAALLRIQLPAMKMYLECLKQRIKIM